MTSSQANSLWDNILKVLDEKMQYGFLEQARAVKSAELDGTSLTLSVTTQEAVDFFQSQVNQQRLIIVSRPFCAVENVFVKLAA